MPILRAIFPLALMLGSLTPRPSGHHASSWPADRRLLNAASRHLVGHRPRATAAWLQRSRLVESAAVGQDGQTLDIRFRDGIQTAILSALSPISSCSTSCGGAMMGPGPISRKHVVAGQLDAGQILQPMSRFQDSPSGARALVLEPFATELEIGSHAGDAEVDDLQAAGYAVDQLYDTNVTLATMKTLPNYNVVYMLTHSGVNQYGEGVIATGQFDSNDPSVDPLIKEYSVLPVGVVGTNQMYYGIMSPYVDKYMGRFPAHSIMFINGCSMLKASIFWHSLAAKGLGSMVSWSEDALTADDTVAAEEFFGALLAGKSVADALNVVRADGHGTSQPFDMPAATIGYLGDGSLTLAAAAPPTPTPTSTAIPSSTPIPAGPSILAFDLAGRVKPGHAQRLLIHSLPGDPLTVTVTYPDGRQRKFGGTADVHGVARFSYRELHSAITARSNRVLVTVIDRANGKDLTREYVIGPGALDLDVEPHLVVAGSPIVIWVRSSKSGLASIEARHGRHVLRHVSARVRAHHWAHVTFRTLPTLHRKSIQVSVRVAGRSIDREIPLG